MTRMGSSTEAPRQARFNSRPISSRLIWGGPLKLRILGVLNVTWVAYSWATAAAGASRTMSHDRFDPVFGIAL